MHFCLWHLLNSQGCSPDGGIMIIREKAPPLLMRGAESGWDHSSRGCSSPGEAESSPPKRRERDAAVFAPVGKKFCLEVGHSSESKITLRDDRNEC
ncbi:hypothetical protein NPIL_639171 [Nephila pilipes]|uniref:Uncharacterized protein n=1 Tax=Nephila pilipes TaxID=299642 RepID=A0A8X6QKS8_NEPPI|nr:hypothetical protein NPIL_639171 [Nephila pilipes]